MSQTTVNLGYVLKNRGEYVVEPETRYYKDNVVQYQGSAFICDPLDYDPDTNPLAYVTTAPYDADPLQPNEGWKVFASDSAYVSSFLFFTENPEWAYVVVDSEEKILFGVRQDGEFIFGAGCPEQVKQYIEERISSLSLDEYEQIVTFMDNLEKGDKKLTEILTEINNSLSDVSTALDTKVDKQEGQSLIDADFASSQSTTESPEYLQVTTDSEGKILEGIKTDGTKVIGADTKIGGSATISGDATVLGNVNLAGTEYKVVENPEWIKVIVDAEDKIICGIRQDGSTYIGQLDGIPAEVQKYLTEQLELFKSKLLKISILGDSISTFNQRGYKIDGYAMHYPHQGDRSADVVSVQDTWWKQVIDASGGILEVNASCSGSTATNSSIGFSSRVPLLGNPNVIYIALGTNDSGNGTPIGNFDYNAASYDLSQFAPAYIKGMQDTIAAYPKAKIVCVAFDMGQSYQDAIKTIATHYGAEYIYVGDISDIHPNKAEMKAVADVINRNFMSLEENPEFIQVTTDNEGKILQSRNTEGINKEYVGFETPKLSIDGSTLEVIEDPEGRIEIKTDSEEKIISYRGSDGVLHENVGISTDKLTLTEDGASDLKSQLDEVSVEKHWYLPKFGKVNIKEETFYLTADPRWSTKDDVVCIQMYDDTTANASARKTLSYYFIKSTLTPLAGGGYDRTSINENSVRLELFPGKEVKEQNGLYYVKEITKVNGSYYLTSTLKSIESGDGTIYSLDILYGRTASTPVNYKDSNPDQTTLSNAIEVKQVKDVPPYRAWFVNKKLEHYCIADIDFGSFYTKTNVPVSIKYQGSGTLANRKRNFRVTFYKNSDYKKKDKIKIGEMLRLSGYNLKSYDNDPSLIKDPVLNYLFMEIWESRGDNCYPWNQASLPFNGATGFVKSFPIVTNFGDEFYGIQFFGIKKDEHNYILDGDNDSSGIFVSGSNDGKEKCFDNASHLDFEDEMMDNMSQETADAIDEFCKYAKGFVDGTIEIDGELIEFTENMLEERVDLANWIDYWIGLETFVLWDNSFHNAIMYSGRDKKKFSLFFYDLDHSIEYAFNRPYIDAMHALNWNVAFWEKFVDIYKDNIINRYAQLRKKILTTNNIRNIYKSFIKDIPINVIEEEKHRWGGDPIYGFISSLNTIKLRLDYLDSNYFNL